MVHLRARASALALEPDDAWMLSGLPRLRLLSHMKNFVRLVQFAWRYRVRFGLSIGCAAMVALLFFTELGAVYPLLHILFDSQNPKRWVAEKITSIENEIRTSGCACDRSRYRVPVCGKQATRFRGAQNAL